MKNLNAVSAAHLMLSRKAIRGSTNPFCDVLLVTVKPIPDTDAVRHHLIPESYMKRFSPDKKRIAVFDRRLGIYRRDGTRNIAVEREFNTIVLKDGSKRRYAEARLAEIDSAFGVCFDKVSRNETLSRLERWCVCFFAAYARTRGPGFRHELRNRPGYGSRPESGFVDEQFAEAHAAVTGIWLDPWVLERMFLEETADIAEGLDDIGGMVQEAFELARHFMWMDWLVGAAPAGGEFITSDRPLVALHRKRTFAEDPLEDDALRAIPLSPHSILVFGDLKEQPALERTVITPETLMVCNAAQVKQSDRWAIASNERHLRAAVRYADLFDLAKNQNFQSGPTIARN
jgi:uncharacterized protein DUF4238